ncbi:MAG TPA: glutaminase A [Burkholderiales bacterium]|nr:glutaminase A [Burkholderiales bacterium]
MDDSAIGHVASQPAIEVGLTSVFEQCLPGRQGEVASYIPELATVDPDRFGVALATIDGRLWVCGDAETEFTIQSISKALTYCLALELLGREEVFRHVGVEPSGDAFNAIVFDPHTDRPFNPMVNAGAITVSALLHRVWQDEAFDILLDRFSKAAGRTLRLSDSVYRSEAETGHRNRAIGHLLLCVGAARQPIEPALDLYFRQCSILVTAADLAQMGATLANIGENPFTGEFVFDVAAVRDTLSVMFTCGMYDYSGNWALDVGIPAKSGVGGGVLGVVNRQLGIGTFSPRLDAKGNSVRGLRVFQKLADEFGLHAFDCTNYGSELVRTLV